MHPTITRTYPVSVSFEILRAYVPVFKNRTECRELGNHEPLLNEVKKSLRHRMSMGASKRS